MRRKSSVIKKDTEPKPSPKESSVMLYSTDDTSASLKFEDYKIVRLIGRGTFGKVFLVQN
jgi:serine/threonine protein kinase